MNSPISVVVVGISGYGNRYLMNLLNHEKYHDIELVGVVDLQPQRSDYYNEIVSRKIPIYHSLEQFYDGNEADLAIISTPIHLHKEQSCYAMTHGSHVLCEKPLTGDSNDIKEIIEVRNRTEKFFAVGFNWSFTSSVQQLKSDILSGLFGKAKRMKCIVLWPRNEDYYNRSSWAGKKYSPAGDKIYDSVANNATAHFLHHLFYLLGDQMDTSVTLEKVTAELYKVNEIETFDTCAVHLKTSSNTDIYYYASHAANEHLDPSYVLEFEKATLTYEGMNDSNNSGIVAQFHHDDCKEGKEKVYGEPGEEFAKLDVCLDVIRGKYRRSDTNSNKETERSHLNNMNILCGAEAASTHVLAIEKMHESVPDIPEFPKELHRFKEVEKFHWVAGLGESLKSAYEAWELPSNMEVEWAVKGKKVKL